MTIELIIPLPQFENNYRAEFIANLKQYGDVELLENIGYAVLTTDKEIDQLAEAQISQPRILPKTKYAKTNSELWNLTMIGADAIEIDCSKIQVAVIDSGISKHPDLNVTSGYDFVKRDRNPIDENGHGTHVAGTIAGKNTGVSNAKLIDYRVLNERGIGSEANVLRAMDLSIREKVDIINLSLGSSNYSRAEANACQACFSAGILVIAAAGNEGYGYSYPASYKGVISVAAVDKKRRHAYFSNVNDMLDLSAPGVGIYSTYPGGYKSLSGTSMASPHVAGAFAIAKTISDQNLEEKLTEVSEELGNKNEFGNGLIRIDKFVQQYKSLKTDKFQ